MNQLQNAGAVAIRQSQVEDQMAALDVNAKDLREIVAVLHDHLRTIINPLAEPPNNKPTPAPVLVPLADQMQNVVESIRGSVDLLRQLDAAIELTA